mmetsp:Transcript_46874/g.34309  ORF Transcript_46874/g.34309 Transcript_46874/m.34309 type:complete len:89 (+) Transcript_46874:696-962(+)|eukprot:CAMPEP_0202960804 /NCGR_PEP_ID=MMETSP1396-20130829/4957_1 /ASSEMBLY_ACC=CAM_ASM_000872 /TAXON_ID= /ORGANISM="Pseudokeronopsis sp., Strain Brazil" /LENGTH=88 /DNA_ID=CAMNT_0049680265 /DNA_START=694 /DNA_END=960 /DNA_ORIENTATION=-
MAINIQISVIKAFDLFPNTLFFGIVKMEPGQLQPEFLFRILTPEFPIDYSKAHDGEITDIEHAKINNAIYFFTSSADGTIKAWTMGPD